MSTLAITVPEMTSVLCCAWCRRPLGYVHGHAACLDGSCPMFGVNQDECCSGDTAANCPTPSSDLAAR